MKIRGRFAFPALVGAGRTPSLGTCLLATAFPPTGFHSQASVVFMPYAAARKIEINEVCKRGTAMTKPRVFVAAAGLKSPGTTLASAR